MGTPGDVLSMSRGFENANQTHAVFYTCNRFYVYADWMIMCVAGTGRFMNGAFRQQLSALLEMTSSWF